MSYYSAFLDAFATSWPSAPMLLASLLAALLVYGRGWLILRRREPKRWRRRQLVAFASGLAGIYLALASPIETFALVSLQFHMVQHLLLILFAPPLLWLGEPLFPFLRGMPRAIRHYWIAPLFRWRPLRSVCSTLTHPITAWLIFVSVNWIWHSPKLYGLALSSNAWHYAQHLSFLLSAAVFWYPVVRPYPSRPKWPRWFLAPYLILADLQNTVLAALITFSDSVIYPYYLTVPRFDGLSALDDQMAAGVLMWVPGSIVFLVPLFVIGWSWLSGRDAGWSNIETKCAQAKRVALPMTSLQDAERLDVLQIPLVGRFLCWRHARLALQLPLLLLAAILVYDGLTGADESPLNLAGVLPWIHWRGFLIFGLAIGGNLFCLACPFMLPRMLARKFLPQPFSWPRRLRNKWLAVVLTIGFLWAYEAFALWDSPWLTAWIIGGYFVGALVIDGLFRGASFCKFVCPIGQFNFVQSLVSPLEVKVKTAQICDRCTTKDCIRGRVVETPPTGRIRDYPGCELNLFLPRKVGNMDCTMCLDCIHACPHDNVAIEYGPPAATLWHDPERSGIGRLSRRRDLAVLVLVLVFGAFANAAGMVAPIVDAQESLRSYLQLTSVFWIVAAYYLAAVVALPLVAVTIAAIFSRWSAELKLSAVENAVRFAYSLAPIGFAMWLTHYSFHFLTSFDAVLPALKQFCLSHGWQLIDVAEPICACCRPVLPWLVQLEILFLDFGLLLSLYSGYRISRNVSPRRISMAFWPWVVLMTLLYTVGIWIILQPMQMRGTLEMGWSQ